VQRAEEIDLDEIREARIIGLTAGASAPEILVDEVIERLRSRFIVTVEAMKGEENVSFKLPRQLRGRGPDRRERCA
jgi:4-hydroxy-3-methylbut-2-enyl diphosphate reductase